MPGGQSVSAVGDDSDEGGTRMPGMVASMLVNAIRVPAKLGARSAWLENTPEYMLPYNMTAIMVRDTTAGTFFPAMMMLTKASAGASPATPTEIFLPAKVLSSP